MDYLADTVAIIRHFTQSGHLGKAVQGIFKQTTEGKNTIWISTISLAEIMYLAERHRIPLKLRELQNTLQGLHNYRILDLNFDIVLIAEKIKGLELHDRLIVASAKFLEVPLLTSDQEIIDSKAIEVLWD